MLTLTRFVRRCSEKLTVIWTLSPRRRFVAGKPTKSQIIYPASRGFSLVFLSVVLPFSSRFWLLAFCFGCFCAEEKALADSRLGFLLSMREMKCGCHGISGSLVGNTMSPPELPVSFTFSKRIS